MQRLWRTPGCRKRSLCPPSGVNRCRVLLLAAQVTTNMLSNELGMGHELSISDHSHASLKTHHTTPHHTHTTPHHTKHTTPNTPHHTTPHHTKHTTPHHTNLTH